VVGHGAATASAAHEAWSGVEVGGVAQVGWRNLELGSAWRALREPLGLGGTCGDREVMVPFRGLESE